MGLYYSGGFDWTFVPGPIKTRDDFEPTKPQSEAYGKYVDAQYRELIARYKPAVLWNDIDYPKSGHPMEIEAEYYNAVPDGVVDNRFGIKHTDYVTPEYSTLKEINPQKWRNVAGWVSLSATTAPRVKRRPSRPTSSSTCSLIS